MLKDKLVLIPARAGSTRVKNKNLRNFGDRPLLAHVIRNAAESGVARVIVSTNSPEIAEVAKSYGAEAPFLRPSEISQATSSSLSAILHALKWLLENEGSVPSLLGFCPPTNPFLQPKSLMEMFDRLEKNSNFESIVTIAPVRSHPFRVVEIGADFAVKTGVVTIEGKSIRDIERTQDWPKVWEGSPACRMTRTAYFMATLDMLKGKYELAQGKTYSVDRALGYQIDSREGMDIDDEMDWAMAEAVYRLNENGN